MAFKRYRGGGGMGGNVVMKGLGQVVGLILGLYVFDTILDATFSYVNSSTWFSTSATFIQSMLPIVGILGVFYIIWRILKKTGMM